MSDFDDNLSIGAQHPDAIADYLEEIGDPEGARQLRSLQVTGQGLGVPGQASPWRRTGVKVGYIGTGAGGRHLAVAAASTTEPDRGLVGRRIKLSLDEFYIESYPGFGEHQVVCEFAGKNQSHGAAEEVRFALTATARDGSGSAIRGAPIFVGLTVAADGLSFEGKTVNVRNSVDDWLLGALGSDTFRSGLTLVTAMQPVLKPFAKLAADAVGSAARRRQNRQISAFKIGLDFSETATSSKLRLGSYAIVQGDDDEWSWDAVRLDTETNKLVWHPSGQPLPRNYMVIGVSEASEPQGSKPARSGSG